MPAPMETGRMKMRIQAETLRVVLALSGMSALALVLEAGRRWF